MHAQNPPIIYRDINLENILLKRNEKKGYVVVKLSDFEISRITNRDSMMLSHCGSQYFMGPEFLVHDGKKCSTIHQSIYLLLVR